MASSCLCEAIARAGERRCIGLQDRFDDDDYVTMAQKLVTSVTASVLVASKKFLCALAPRVSRIQFVARPLLEIVMRCPTFVFTRDLRLHVNAFDAEQLETVFARIDFLRSVSVGSDSWRSAPDHLLQVFQQKLLQTPSLEEFIFLDNACAEPIPFVVPFLSQHPNEACRRCAADVVTLVCSDRQTLVGSGTTWRRSDFAVPHHRREAIRAGAVDALVSLLEKPVSCAEAWHDYLAALRQIFIKNDAATREHVERCLSVMPQFLDSPAAELRQLACMIVSHATDQREEGLAAALQAQDGAVMRMIINLVKTNDESAYEATRILTNFSSVNDDYAAYLVRWGLLEMMPRHLATVERAGAGAGAGDEHDEETPMERKIRKELCWCLSNLTIGFKKEIVEAGGGVLLPLLVKCALDDDAAHCQKEAVYALLNMCNFDESPPEEATTERRGFYIDEVGKAGGVEAMMHYVSRTKSGWPQIFVNCLHSVCYQLDCTVVFQRQHASEFPSPRSVPTVEETLRKDIRKYIRFCDGASGASGSAWVSEFADRLREIAGDAALEDVDAFIGTGDDAEEGGGGGASAPALVAVAVGAAPAEATPTTAVEGDEKSGPERAL